MTLSREQIEQEKQGKPRVDLVPATALAAIGDALATWDASYNGEVLSRALSCLAYGARARSIPALAEAWIWCAVTYHYTDGLAVAVGKALLVAGEIMAVGLRKHGLCTWRVAGTEQADPQTHYASACRHVAEAFAGLEADRDSGRPPLTHALTQIAILIDLLVDPPMVAGENDGHAMLPPPPMPVSP